MWLPHPRIRVGGLRLLGDFLEDQRFGNLCDYRLVISSNFEYVDGYVVYMGYCHSVCLLLVIVGI